MERAAVLVICLALVLGLGTAINAVGSEEGGELRVPLGYVTLSPPQDADPKKSDVEFPHGLHFKYSCQECHHNWEGSADNLTCMTSGCHDLVQAPRDNPEQSILYFKNAYHELCIGCHKKIKAENRQLELSGKVLKEKLPNSGPTGCTECHPEW